MGIYWIQLGTGRRLHTVEWFEGHHSEEAPIQAQSPVDWETSIPWGAQLFSVTSGVSAARVRQFWVGWLSGGDVHMEALTEEKTLSSPLVAGESPVFPAVMDGSGAASFYTWRPTATGSALWKRGFSGSAVGPARMVLEIPGQALASRVATVPGLRSEHAVVGWVEHTEGLESILGAAVIEAGRAKVVLRSKPVPWTKPVTEQRMGAWASSLDRFEVACVLTGDGGPAGHSTARFGASPDTPKGAVTIARVELGAPRLLRSAIDYYRDRTEPVFHQALLLSNGQLLGEGGSVIREAVPLDSILPIVTTWRGVWWAARSATGVVSLEGL
jgi:hypothetical protein